MGHEIFISNGFDIDPYYSPCQGSVSVSYILETHVAEGASFCYKDGFHLSCFKNKGECKKEFANAVDPTQPCLKEG